MNKIHEQDEDYAKSIVVGHLKLDAAKKVWAKDTDEFLAYVYLRTADRFKYGSLLKGMDDQFNLGNDQYPKTLLRAHELLTEHKWDQAHHDRQKNKRKSSNNNNTSGDNQSTK